MKISDILQADLVSDMPIEQVFQKHVIDGTSHFFREIRKDINQEYQLRFALAESLGISINDVVIVGSAKLGFSLKSSDFVGFDYKFSISRLNRDKSDVDIAIVNRKLYDNSIEEIFHLSRHFDKDWINKHWKINAFNPSPSNLHEKYANYLAKGWLRPDYFPSSYFENSKWRLICDNWFRNLGRRKISIGFYSDWVYLKHYQMDNLESLRLKFQMGACV